MPVHIGDVLAGKYQVESVLGVGGMGVVVAARHLQLEQKVALKFLLPQAMQSKEAVERFQREARSAVRLRSEHVAKVTDVGVLDTGAPYMVMEFLEGADLGEVVKATGSIAVDEAVHFVLQASEAIAEAHSIGIIHRDLKPQNLFVTRRVDGKPLVKVLDFGISKTIDTQAGMALTRTSSIMGSPLYMSPEQMRSSKSVDQRSDIWALGVILYELLTGRVPFEAEAIPELCLKVVQDPVVPPRQLRDSIPEALSAIVCMCLEKEPANRYPNVAELAAALEPYAPESRGATDRIAATLNVPSRPPVVSVSHTSLNPKVGTGGTAWGTTQAVPGRRRNRVPLFVGGGVALAAVLGAVVVAMSGGRSQAAPHVPDSVVTPSATVPTTTAPQADTGKATPPVTVTAEPPSIPTVHTQPTQHPAGTHATAHSSVTEPPASTAKPTKPTPTVTAPPKSFE